MAYGVRERTWVKIARQDALKQQKSRCLYCYDPLAARTATAEHRKAKSRGGSDTTDNIGASCQPCNALKGSAGEKAFINSIKNPKSGGPIAYWLAWNRRRINLAEMRACRNILRYVGHPEGDL
jgi:hypothetical protein